MLSDGQLPVPAEAWNKKLRVVTAGRPLEVVKVAVEKGAGNTSRPIRFCLLKPTPF